MGHRQHRRQGSRAVPCAIVTVSDTRTKATDRSGAFIHRALKRAGHPVVDQRILKDEPKAIRAHLARLARASNARVVLFTGGTGIAARDRTYEAVDRLLEKRLDGFGEIFRWLSYREIGPAAMLSRAVAGTYGRMTVFSMPGSEAAVKLALRKLILPEISHLAGLLDTARP
jgi:molybdenum cofactor biosynthesis protein B